MRPIMLHMLIRPRLLVLASLALTVVPLGAIAADRSDQKFPDVMSVKITPRSANLFDFDVTVSSPYDTPQRYADAIRVLAKPNVVLGERILFHDHADEQPFTRDVYGVKIPPGIRVVVVQARDKVHGYGGKTVEVTLPGR
jgi:hypothetical protein